MVIADRAMQDREREGRPVRVGVVGAGVTGRLIALQLLTPPPGIRLVAISNRNVDRAIEAFGLADVRKVVRADTAANIEDAVESG